MSAYDTAMRSNNMLGGGGYGPLDLSALLASVPGPQMLPMLAANFGGKLLGGLAGVFAGPSWQERGSKRLAGRIEGELDNPLISRGQINSLTPDIMNQITPYLNKLFGDVSRNKGLDSGAAQGEVLKGAHENILRWLGGVKQQALFANAEAPLQRERLLASLLR